MAKPDRQPRDADAPPPDPTSPETAIADGAQTEAAFVAASSGIAEADLLSWRFDRADRRLTVVTVDGRKLCVDLEPEGAR